MKMFKPILSTVEKAAQDAIREGGREVLRRARDKSPTLTGESDRSGFMQVDDMTVQVGFTSLVSRLQHEDLDNQHPQGGEAKFLEKAFDEVDIEQIAAQKVREAFG
ncbi:hypothetical protein [Microbacterium sp. p3-SID131]|uniref:hypothetical protein n=1 Tax=Microbacterium sp. p3-SID131 TaxID=2916215 RepID=UPI0021A5037E|nr:hypothetical protein [Microbacterium sp. p3-SID131]MCT1363965.1 hypothetical protein [Microbacterium sp. p3-SID131]